MSSDKSKLWGGAFTKEPSEIAWRFGQSIQSDLHLLDEEVTVSIAHAQMLGKVKIISASDSKQLVQALKQVPEIVRERTDLAQFEDIHAAVESTLRDLVGELADKLHAGRSRNDQIIAATSLWIEKRLAELELTIDGFQETLVRLAEKHQHDPIPAYTHQQPAQPITLGFYLLAYVWMLERDYHRLDAILHSTGKSPLGAGAVAGTTLPIEPALGGLPFENALDAVSNRDMVGDSLHACATIMQHLSRLANEIVLFSTSEFGYLRLDDSMSTGSSIMPQKRNPDFAELIRGRSARAIGNWVTFMTMMKALPLGYNRDMQDDKPLLFDSVQLCLQSVALCKEMLQTATWNLPRMQEMATSGFSTATAVAEALVMEGLPFRQAHEAVGKLVLYCEQRGKKFEELTEEDARAVGISVNALKAATLEGALAAKISYGSPGHVPLADQLKNANKGLRSN